MAQRRAQTLEEKASDGVVSFESSFSGPEGAIRSAAAIMIGSDPVRDPGNMSVAQEVDGRLYAHGAHSCRLFKMSSETDSNAYAELLSKEANGLVSRLGTRELISGTDYALFVHWVEFRKPESELRKDLELDVKKMREKFVQRLAGHGPAKPSGGVLTTDEGLAIAIDNQCRGVTASGARCRRRRSPASVHCKHHHLSAEPRLDQPPTHCGLQS